MPEAQQRPTFLWLLTSDGASLWWLGLIVAAGGIVLLVRPNRLAVTVVACMSLVPAVLALFVVYSAATDYGEMAMSKEPPKLNDLVDISTRVMKYSFCGLLGTVVAMFFSFLALSRASERTAGPERREKQHSVMG